MLELRGLTGGYGETTVLHDVTLDVPDSSVVALLGPNGAGKSTTLRMASGILRPTQGAVMLDGRDITGLSSFQRARLGVCHIPEGRGVFPDLSVRENLLLFAPKGESNAVYERCIDAFPILGQRQRQQAGTLSGGEQQMLSLARAYASNPRVVLVDEASLGLAPLVIDAIFEFLARLASEGVALLIVEQYVARALALASTACVLYKGSVMHTGPTASLDADSLFALYGGSDLAGTEIA